MYLCTSVYEWTWCPDKSMRLRSGMVLWMDRGTDECLLLARLKAKKHDHDNCWFMPGITDIIPEKVTKLVTKAFIAAWSKTRELGLCHAWPIGR